MKTLSRRPKKEKILILRCPACGKNHPEHNEFGCFCCASCLQTIIRPLIVTLTSGQLRPNA
jgi:protein-arginine kinase activator protein McsA